MSFAGAQEKNCGLVQSSHQDGRRGMKTSLKSESKMLTFREEEDKESQSIESQSQIWRGTEKKPHGPFRTKAYHSGILLSHWVPWTENLTGLDFNFLNCSENQYTICLEYTQFLWRKKKKRITARKPLWKYQIQWKCQGARCSILLRVGVTDINFQKVVKGKRTDHIILSFNIWTIYFSISIDVLGLALWFISLVTLKMPIISGHILCAKHYA